MRRIGFILCMFCSLAAFGQMEYHEVFDDSVKEISWSCGVTSQFVTLNAKPSSLSVKCVTHKIRKRSVRRKTRRVKISKKEFAMNYALYNSLNREYVHFPISKDDKDSLRSLMKNVDSTGKPFYNLDTALLEKYLEKDTIQVDMSVFAMDSFNNFVGRVIGGVPFRFRMMSISSNNDTLVQHYNGNLFGGDRYRDLPKYLMYARIFNETDVYKRLPFNEYFSRSNILRVILWYIEGKEGLIEFKPFELVPREDLLRAE